MVAKFSVLGSCGSRDIFHNGINNDYKKYFFIVVDWIRILFISLMQIPIEYDEQDLEYICSNFDVDELYFNSNILDDVNQLWRFNKTLLNFDLEYIRNMMINGDCIE